MLKTQDRLINALTIVATLGAAAVFVPFWAPLLLAAWAADLVDSLAGRFERFLGGRERAAWALILLLCAFVLVPMVGVGVSLSIAMEGLEERVRALLEGRGTGAGLLLGGASVGEKRLPTDWAGLATRHGASAWSVLSSVARASLGAFVAGLVFFAAFYSFIVDGRRIYAWMERSAPIAPADLARLAAAFRETGRGLIVAGGGTALLQGVIATIGYVAIGVPRAFVLGPLTAVCALVPFIGTGLVWVPLAIELAASGHHVRAALIVGLGVLVSVIDNIVRPMFARYGKLTLPGVVVLISMLGGVAVFGAKGALLGPLLVRLCTCALDIAAERRRATQQDAPVATTQADG